MKVTAGTIKVGTALTPRRSTTRAARAIRANHSATHLLHEALRLVLGDHVAQKGSLVSPDRLRFDFVHTKPIIAAGDGADRRASPTTSCSQNSPVETRLMGVEEAKESGARALFGEKYGDEVRVVSMGDPTGNALGWSVELCGGTHVRRTGDIGLITVLGESGVSAGVRRIEALTATRRAPSRPRQHQSRRERRRRAAHDAGRNPQPHRSAAGQPQEGRTRRSATRRRSSRSAARPAPRRRLPAKSSTASNFVGRAVEGVAAKDLRGLVDAGKEAASAPASSPSSSRARTARAPSRSASPTISSAKFSAADLIKHATAALGGQGGGGRPDMAQGGGPDGSKADAAIAAVRAAL